MPINALRRRFALAAVCVLATPAAFAQSAPANQPADEEVLVLSPFTITREKDRGYASYSSMGASRVAIPVSDLASTIVTLNEQFLLDRAAVDAPEALSFVSGVQRTADRAPGQEQFSLRGYAVVGLQMRDGLPDPFSSTDQPYDESSSYERIEIIKGPAGTLYGSQSMGGIVNKVSKWPLFRRQTRVELQAQSNDRFYRAMLDTTGPLTDTLAYRLVLSARNGDRYYDEDDAPNNFYNITASATWLLGERGSAGKVWARGQHLDIALDRENGWQFITGFLNPASPTTPPTVTNGRYPLAREANTVPSDDISDAQIFSFETGYEKSWTNTRLGSWTLRTVARGSKGAGDRNPSYSQGRPVPVDASGAVVRYTNASGALVNGDNRFIAANDPRVADWRAALVLRDFRGSNENLGLFADLVGDFHTGPLAHKIVLSGTATDGESERAFFFWNAANPANTTAVANSFSAIRPTPANITATTIKNSGVARQFNPFSGRAEIGGRAVAVQDNVSLLDNRLIFALGARRDIVDITNHRFDSAASLAQDRFVVNPALTTKATSRATTYKYGVVGKPAEGVSIYAQHSETFSPIGSLNAAGQKNPDQEGESDEVGVKLELLQGRIVGTLTWFDMQLTNVLLTVINPPELGGGFVLRPVGVQKTDGFEFDIAVEPLPGLNLLASYSRLTSVDENNRRFRGVPIDATYGLFARYAFRGDRLKGFALGAGWKHSGKSAGDANNTFFLPDNDMFDAFLGYETARWGVQMNVFNLADTDAMLSSITDQQVFRAEPRNFRVTFRYSF